ncbi:MAG: acyltransferase [Saprospiraceae bacterium]|nr:acyltransferase [Saprospiraceae bacterium]
MKYRAEIDGLRAIAIIPVLLYHLSHDFMPYGFIGVDIFFLISGFLIASIISKKVKENNFSILEFYERRIKRITPLYFLVISISIPFALILLLPHQLVDFSQSVVASLFFLSNYFFYFDIDYFNPFVEYSPLIHTWSLSVEEQFYLVLPILLIIFRNAKRNFKIGLFAVLAILSMLYCFHLSETNLSLAFYSSIARAWELLLGVLLSFVKFDETSSQKNNKVLDVLGIGSLLLLIAILAGVIDFKHPGPFSIVPVVLSAIIVLLSHRKGLLNRLLKTSFLVHIGLLSYSLYLIHQPAIAFLKIWNFSQGIQEFSMVQILGILALIYCMSVLSYNFYEKPIRYSKVSRWKVFASFAVASLLFSGIGFYGHKSRGLKENFINKYGTAIKYDADKVKEDAFDYPDSFSENDSLNGDNKDILLIGDSMAGDLFLSLNYNDNRKNQKLYKIDIDDPCLMDLIKKVLSGEEDEKIYKCGKFQDTPGNIRQVIQSSSIVIFSSLWTNKTYEDGIQSANLIKEVYNKEVYMVGPAQFSDINVISVDLAKKGIPKDSVNWYIGHVHLREDKFLVNQKMKELIRKDVNYIDKFQFFNNGEEYTLFYDDGYPKLWDDAHLSRRGMEEYGRFINSKLNINEKTTSTETLK